MTEYNKHLHVEMLEAQKHMRTVARLLSEKSCSDWRVHGTQIYGAAEVLQTWIEAIEAEDKDTK